MQSFLSIVASDILNKYGTDLSRTVIVFPNKRASLFLNEELVRQATCGSDKTDKCIWSPRYVTISELFRKQTKLLVADHIKLVCELYGIYTRISGSTETLDEFYSWGELLLSDFDDVDKNMGDATHIFENTSELHEYDTVSFLNDKQAEILQKFFKNFTIDHESKLRKNFEQLWNKLGQIYSEYRQHLLAQNIAYEGLLYREVVESVTANKTELKIDAERFLFVGFNMVQKVEQDMFKLLQKNAEVHYYWDYDEYYVNDSGNGDVQHEAGHYIKELLQEFPNEIDDRSVYRNFERKQKGEGKITFINASTEDIQARYVAEWLTPERIEAGKRTAIVLCNEALLPTVINCLPEEVKHVNITTGYPLANTPVNTLVQQYFSFVNYGKAHEEGHFRLHYVNSLLHHPYMRYVSDQASAVAGRLNEEHVFFPNLDDIAEEGDLREVFRPFEEPTARERNIAIANRVMWILKSVATTGTDSPLMQESIYRMYTLLSRVRTLAEEDGLDVDTMTFERLITQAIRTTSVPFHGEPVVGIQIMGVLETRNLDFDHVLLLSCNEGNMPKGVNDASFIPHAIRHAYNLTTIDNKVGIYAYYFHRLLQRAKDVEICFNSSTEDGQMGEKSRFMQQLLAESGIPISLKTFTAPLKAIKSERKEIVKTKEITDKLDKTDWISASALNSYLRCPLTFYYKYVCNIKDTNDDVEETDFDQRVFGLIFHRAAQILYGEFVGKHMTVSNFEALLDDKLRFNNAIDNAIKIELFKISEEKAASTPMPHLNGSELIKRNVIVRLLRQLLMYDKANAPIYINGLEKKFYHDIKVGERIFHITAIIDRLDTITNNGKPQMRVVDYKTGSKVPEGLETIGLIFDATKVDKHTDYYLQTILYSLIVGAHTPNAPSISPCLLYPSKALKEDYSPALILGSKYSKTKIESVEEYKTEFITGLKQLIAEIFSHNVPFSPTPDTKRCERCFYSGICQG